MGYPVVVNNRSSNRAVFNLETELRHAFSRIFANNVAFGSTACVPARYFFGSTAS